MSGASVQNTATDGDVLDVVVIGAGITGIFQLYRLRQEGFRARILEAGGGVGGTWYWNRYPGSRFDSESYTYGYFFSKELFEEWEWSEHFASQPETEAYLNHVVDRFDLRADIELNVRVAAAEFDAGVWTITGTDGRQFRTRFVIAATGILSAPFFPEVEGRGDFRGQSFHTGLWPSEPVDFAGKRVAVVGTGASAVQLIPVIADAVESLTVYQRTANWCSPLRNAAITAEEQEHIRANREDLYRRCHETFSGFMHPDATKMTFDDTEEERRAHYQELWNTPGLKKMFSNYADLIVDPAANKQFSDFIAEKIRETVADPETADKLIPKDHGFAMKRPPLETGYYQAFNNPCVSLVDLRETPILRVTETGIETAEGLREFDIIVWATGFDAITGALTRIDVRGEDGRLLREYWTEGPRTYLGIQVAGFPNFFMVGGPQSVFGNVPRGTETHVEFVTELLDYARHHGYTRVETDDAAEAAWVRHVDEASAPFLTADSVWYQGSNIPGKAKRFLIYPAGANTYAATVRAIADKGFEGFTFSGAPASAAGAQTDSRPTGLDVISA
jgi:cation diffusion facilitator CzcD-associated flavoprotein CzcO